jgi:hypothetical protein
MAASLTDHVWTTTDLLSYRVPPHFLYTLPELERLYPPFDPTLTVDGYMETDVINLFPRGYEKIPRTRTGKKMVP